jgi:hypothetical protein
LLKKPGYADRAQAALASMGDSDPAELAGRRPADAPTAPASSAPAVDRGP